MVQAFQGTQRFLWGVCCAAVLVFFLALPFASLDNEDAKTVVWQPGIVVVNSHHPISADQEWKKHEMLAQVPEGSVPSINEIDTASREWLVATWRRYRVETSFSLPGGNRRELRATTDEITSTSVNITPLVFVVFIVAVSRLSLPKWLGGSAKDATLSASRRALRTAVITILGIPVFFCLLVWLSPHYVS